MFPEILQSLLFSLPFSLGHIERTRFPESVQVRSGDDAPRTVARYEWEDERTVRITRYEGGNPASRMRLRLDGRGYAERETRYRGLGDSVAHSGGYVYEEGRLSRWSGPGVEAACLWRDGRLDSVAFLRGDAVVEGLRYRYDDEGRLVRTVRTLTGTAVTIRNPVVMTVTLSYHLPDSVTMTQTRSDAEGSLREVIHLREGLPVRQVSTLSTGGQVQRSVTEVTYPSHVLSTRRPGAPRAPRLRAFMDGARDLLGRLRASP